MRFPQTLLYGLTALGAVVVLHGLYSTAVPDPADLPPTRLLGGGSVDLLPATLAAHLHVPIVEGNRIETLVNGVEVFPAMLSAIASARSSVHLLSYIFSDDAIAHEFADSLAAAARRGVEVRLLVDAFGAHEMPEEIADRIRAAGGRVARFHPVHWYTIRRLNNRTHRRAFVVDGRIGFTGGTAIAEPWTGDGGTPDHWRDQEFRIEGPLVRYIQGAFAENWWQATGAVLSGPLYFPELEPAGETLALPIATAPADPESALLFLYWSSLMAARERVHISTPYFVPDPGLVNTIAATARRGVEVALLVPGERNDWPVVGYAGRAYYGDLLDAGVRIFEYRPTMIHAKTMTVDGRWAVIGTPNLDNRSFELNYELAVGALDTTLAGKLDRLFRADLANAREITQEEVRGWSWLERLRHRAANLFREQM